MTDAYIFGDSRVSDMQTYINDQDTGDLDIRVLKFSSKGLFVITTEVINEQVCVIVHLKGAHRINLDSPSKILRNSPCT